MLLLIAAINWSVVIPLLGIFIGPVFAYLIAARRFSGRIGSSEADSLWKESSNLRLEYKTEMDELRTIVTNLRVRVNDLEDKNEVLHLENGELRAEVSRLRRENALLKARIEELEREASQLRSAAKGI